MAKSKKPELCEECGYEVDICDCHFLDYDSMDDDDYDEGYED